MGQATREVLHRPFEPARVTGQVGARSHLRGSDREFSHINYCPRLASRPQVEPFSTYRAELESSVG